MQVSVRTADFILRRFGWLIFLGGALGNGLTDSSENTGVEHSQVAGGLGTVDRDTIGSGAL